MTDATPMTVAGALRAYLVANLPDMAIYRNVAPADTAAPVAVIIDPTDTFSTDLGDEILLGEQVQVDLYIDQHDASGIADILHTLIHNAPIGIPGSQIHSVKASSRRTETDADSEVTRVIYTVDVKRRITPGDNTTPLPFPVRPDILAAHEADTHDVHGIADTSLLETTAGAQAKADEAEAFAKAYTDSAVAGFQLPEDVETTAGAQAKADAAEAAAQAYTDTTVAAIDLSPYITTADATTVANDTASAAAQDAVAASNAYTNIHAIAKTEKAAPGGVATLGLDGRIPSNQQAPLAISDTHVVATEAEMLALDAQRGDMAVRTDLSRSFVLRIDEPTDINSWQEFSTPPDHVLSVDGRAGAISLQDLYDPAGAADASQAASEAYADAAIAAIDFTPYETITGAQAKADAAGSNAVSTATATANAYTDTAVAAYVPLTDARLTNARTPSGAAGGDLIGAYPNPSLAAVGTSGTYTKVTTDAKGRVTAGGSLVKADIPTIDVSQVSGSAYDWVSNYPSMPVLATSNVNTSGWAIYSRMLQGGTVTKVGLLFGPTITANGTFSVGFYRNTGTGRTATPSTLIASLTMNVLATWSSTYQEFSFATPIDVKPGDWFAILTSSGSLANVKVAYGNLISSIVPAQRPGVIAFEGNGLLFALPATANAQTATAPTNGGIPYLWGLA